jgi:murein DD-endopeptidase MepM/ murein hydrolase activator NlpD
MAAAEPVSTFRPQAKPATLKPVSKSGPIVHRVAPGETLISISRHYGVQVTALAAANRIPPHAKIKMGDQLVIPGHVAQSAPPAPPAPKVTAAIPAKPVAAAPAPAVAAVKPVKQVETKVASIPPQAPTPTAHIVTPAAEAVDNDSATGNAGFRWPVRGRVITAFGAKTNGQQNDGINLAVPEGTAIRAADDGVVAYSGNELKGYGNLVLVRHNNGYVTAYAHASELMVKRGDAVKRGQVIAKAGQTGSVTSPQLHFEIRKGSAPVDPMPFLPGA